MRISILIHNTECVVRSVTSLIPYSYFSYYYFKLFQQNKYIYTVPKSLSLYFGAICILATFRYECIRLDNLLLHT